MKTRLLIAFCVIPGTQVLGHGYAIYASTPLTPPVELRWWWPFAVLILWGSVAAAFRFVLGQSKRAAAMRGLAVVVLFALAFFLLGTGATLICTAPLPGLGPPFPTYRGMGWGFHLGPFVFWNVIGVLLLGKGILLLAGKRHSEQHRRKLLRVGTAGYCLALVPYVACGAYVHGWAGGHIDIYCMSNLDRLTAAVCDYADAHGGTLPVAADINELGSVIQPYFKGAGGHLPFPPTVCPAKQAFERTPQNYRWRADLSGRRLAGLNDGRLENQGLIACPYHGYRQGFRTKARIKKSLELCTSQPASGPSVTPLGNSR